jgi:myosin heavy subunit
MKTMKKNILAFTILTTMSGTAMAVDRAVSTAGTAINQESTSLSTLQYTAPVKNYAINNKGYQELKTQLINSNSIAMKELYTNHDTIVKSIESSYKNSVEPLVQRLTAEKQTLAKLISEKITPEQKQQLEIIQKNISELSTQLESLKEKIATESKAIESNRLKMINDAQENLKKDSALLSAQNNEYTNKYNEVKSAFQKTIADDDNNIQKAKTNIENIRKSVSNTNLVYNTTYNDLKTKLYTITSDNRSLTLTSEQQKTITELQTEMKNLSSKYQTDISVLNSQIKPLETVLKSASDKKQESINSFNNSSFSITGQIRKTETKITGLKKELEKSIYTINNKAQENQSELNQQSTYDVTKLESAKKTAISQAESLKQSMMTSSTSVNESIQKINMLAKAINAKTDAHRTELTQTFYKTNTIANQKVALANTELLNYAKNNGVSISAADKITPESVGVRNMSLSNTQYKIDPQQIIKDIYNSMNTTAPVTTAPVTTSPVTTTDVTTAPVTTTPVTTTDVTTAPVTTTDVNYPAVQPGAITSGTTGTTTSVN